MADDTSPRWTPAAARVFVSGAVPPAFVFAVGLGCAYGDPYDPEDCSNADDRDGRTDCEDAECGGTELWLGGCENAVDDDGDGASDCEDASCRPSEAC